MENQTISLDLITVTDPSVIRAIKHVRTQNYSKEALERDATRDTPRGLKDSKLCLFSIGGKVFNADLNDQISKIIIGGRQSELYSISFTAGEEYKDAKDAKHQGINFSSCLTRKQYEEDIAFEQGIILAKSKADLEIMEKKARIRKDYYISEMATMPDLEDLISGKE